MNNSVIGKTIQNNRKQRDIQIVTNKWKRNRLTSLVNFKGMKNISLNSTEDKNLPKTKLSFWCRKIRTKYLAKPCLLKLYVSFFSREHFQNC